MKYNPRTTAIPEIIPVVLICTAGIISVARMHLYLPLLLHRDYFRRSNASLSCSFAPQGLFPPAGFISILLFCYTEIISAGQMHLYLALLLHRDYFAPAKCISISRFCSTGMISAGRMHLYLPLLLHRDYFQRPDASLSCSFLPQGLFPPSGCISILLFCPTGIISTGQMHLYLALLPHRDYFAPVGCISIFLFCSTGIISTGRIHLYLPLLLHRDYFCRPDASLSCSFVPQGLFPPAECISIFLFLLHRDYFAPSGCISAFLFCPTGIILPRLDASLSSSFAPQGLFPPVGFISIFLFCSTGIISAGQMHLYLALLLHRDYFRQPNASLIRAPVKYQRPNFYYTGNTRMASADTLCKKLPQDRQKTKCFISFSFIFLPIW